MKLLGWIVACSFLAAGLCGQVLPVTVSSPDGSIELTIATLAQNQISVSGGQLAYRVTLAGKPVFNWSQMGLELEGQPLLGAKVRLTSSKTSSADETYKLVVGKSASARNHYNAAVVELEELGAPNRRFSVEVRVFNDGAAFRYTIPPRSAWQTNEPASISPKTPRRTPCFWRASGPPMKTTTSSFLSAPSRPIGWPRCPSSPKSRATPGWPSPRLTWRTTRECTWFERAPAYWRASLHPTSMTLRLQW
jgi:hypothetical protein